MTGVDELLRAARDRLAARDPSCYPALRDAWRACRCAELAALVEQAGRITPWPDNFKTEKAWQAAWIETARRGDPLVVGALLQSLAPRLQGTKAAMVCTCLDELVDFRDDPQLVTLLLGMVERSVASAGWIKIHTRAFKRLDAAGDPRAIDGLRAACARTPAQLSSWKGMADSLARGERVRQSLLARFPNGVPLLPAELAPLVAELAAAIASSAPIAAPSRVVDEGTSLLDAVFADPFDDARRLVCADALQATGDPRGELIVAQMSDSPDAAKRATSLVAKHRSGLLGPLAKVVSASSAVFEKGFLARCEAGVSRKVAVDAAFDRPEWATVTHLACTGYAKLAPAMRALTEVTGMPTSGLACLATATLPRLEILGIGSSSETGDGLKGTQPASPGLRALARTTGLPKLRELRLELQPREWHTRSGYRGDWFERDAHAYAWVFEAPFAAQLESVHVRVPGAAALLSWLDVLRARKTLRNVVATVGYIAVTLTTRSGQLRTLGHAPPATAENERNEIRAALPDLAWTET